MKRKRSMSKTVLSFCLAVLLALQTVTFIAATYAESAVSEADSQTATEPSVTDAVYAGPEVAAPMALAADPAADKTAVFLGANSPFPLEVKQGNAVISPEGTIQGRQQFTLKSEDLKLPVNGDAPDPNAPDRSLYIQKGDWIELTRAEHFKEVVLPKANNTLTAQTESDGPKKLGTVFFTLDSIKIVFDGDDYFFGGVGTAVTFSFETTADSDLAGLVYGQSKEISIFGSKYQLKNPDITPAYSITLSSPGQIKWDQYSYRGIQPAQFVDGAITWQSTVSAFDQFDATIKLPLDGKMFFTDPATYTGNVKGVYVPGSFKVNGELVDPADLAIDANGALSYVFPAATGEDPQVEYKTWIPKEGYYYEHRSPPGNLGRSYRVMLGKVALQEMDGTGLASAAQEISFAPDWIQASASYDHPNETITWTIVVNQYNKQGLKDFTITNVLPAGLEVTSATWRTWVNGVESDPESITADANSVYSFGDIDGKVQLVIKTKITGGGPEYRIDPRANWNLETQDGIQDNDVITGIRPGAVTDEAIVTVGAHTFTKGGTITQDDYNLGGITWTVALTPQYAIPGAAVYDVLVHGGNLSVLDNAVDATGEVDQATIAKIKANINDAQLWKMYHKDTLKSTNGLTLKAIPLTVNGEVVADLIKVTGYTTDQPASFSFRALETNTDVLFRQDINVEKTRWNRALLFDGETVKLAQNSINLHLRMLNKDMLFASKPLKVDGTPENVTPNNVGSYITNDNNEAWTISAYDQTTKTVTFRLGVNMPGYNTVEMAKDGGSRVITNVKLLDTLPEDWEFVPFSEEKDFELWKGYSDNGSGTGYGVRNDAKAIIEPNDPAHVVSFSHIGNVGTFTFSKLESPYVILVKARPSNAALEKYLDEYTTNGTVKQVLYNKADLHMTWGGAEKVLTEQRKVIVPVRALGKSVTKPFAGVLEWTVNYYPPYNMDKGVLLQDTLGAGMNLRKDGNGDLVLTAPSMAIYRAKLTPGGTLERVGDALNLEDPDSEVQVTLGEPGADGTTVLNFNLTKPNIFYQFVYQTEVDRTKATAGQKMGNEIKLVGDDKLESVSAKSEITLDSSDVAGASGANASLALKKVAPDCATPLAGVQFTLFNKAGVEVAKGTTGTGGTLNLLFSDPGFYELKETIIDTTTWLPTTKIFQVYVGSTPGKPIWVDGIKATSTTPFVVCTPDAGNLLVKNSLEGNGKNTNKEFNYNVTFSGVDEGGDKEYSYIYTKQGGGTETRTIKSGETITLKHNETALFKLISKGTEYTVTQVDYNKDGYSTNSGDLTQTGNIPSGIVPSTDTAEAPFVSTRNVGGLLISNTVTGGELDKGFEYTVEFEGSGEGGDKEYSYTYTKQEGGTEPRTIKSGEKLTLKHGETAVFTDILTGAGYSVTQKDYTEDGYTTDPTSLIRFGSIETGSEKKAEFVNTAYGGLLIGNTVTGNGGEPGKEFAYTVTFTGTGASETYVYVKSDGTSDIIESGDKITLKHGQTITVNNLPVGLGYTIIQTDYSDDEYTTNPGTLQHTGSIARAVTSEAKFVNHRDLPGGLRIGNTVTGNGGDLDKVFEYTVTFTGPGAGKTYSYTKSDGASGTIQSSGKLELKHGQTVTIEGIYKDTAYTVVESDYTTYGYSTEPANRTFTGIIVEMEIAEARYVNARYLPGTLALEAAPKKVPGDGKTPSELTATLTGTDGQPVEGKEIVFKLADGTEIGRAITDEDGKAKILFTPLKLSDTTPKDYEIVATTTATSPSGVPYNEAKDTVTAMPAALTGVLRDNNTGKVIPNAVIVIKNVGTGEEQTITTDTDGYYYHPVKRDEEYTITYTRLIEIGGTSKPIPFTQKAVIEGTDPTTEGNLIPAEITAVGIVLFQQPDGQTAQFSTTLTSKMRIYLKDASGEYVKDLSGAPKAFDMEDGGTFAAEGLTEQTYTMEVRYEAEPGKELTLTTAKLNVKADGELNISVELVDPYGTVYDKTTGDAVTGKKIANAEVRLYFANTQRNIDKGYVPGTQVDLPPVPNFPPHDNKSIPWQPSDVNGFYAFMVFPVADYYLVVSKSGYETYTSPRISVEFDIVKHDVPMAPIIDDDPDGDPGPVDPEPGNPKPDTTEPGTPEPGIPEPGIPEPGTPEPGTPEPGTPEPGSPEPGHPGPDNPGVTQPGREDNDGTDHGSGSGNGNIKKDKVPKTGDSSMPPIFYMGLALLSLTMIGLLLFGSKKKKYIQ